MKNTKLYDRETADTENTEDTGNGQKKDAAKRVDVVFRAVIVGMAAVFLLANPSFARFISPELVLMLISGVALILCISVALFCFVKPRAWIYRVIAAAVSVIAGYRFFQFFWEETYFLADLKGVIPDFLYEMIEEKPELPWTEIIEGVYLGYSAVIFGAALVVQYVYKRIKRKSSAAKND